MTTKQHWIRKKNSIIEKIIYGCIGNAQMEHSALGFYRTSIWKHVLKTMKIIIIISILLRVLNFFKKKNYRA
jgi:hypothetical protein